MEMKQYFNFSLLFQITETGSVELYEKNYSIPTRSFDKIKSILL